MLLIRTKLLMLAALFTSTSQSLAVGLPQMTFDEQVNESDIVVFAKPKKGLRNGFHRTGNSGRVGLTEMNVSRVLKGQSDIKVLYLVTKDEIAERNPNCCIEGRLYLLLLKGGRDNMFEAVNGRHGVIKVN